MTATAGTGFAVDSAIFDGLSQRCQGAQTAAQSARDALTGANAPQAGHPPLTTALQSMLTNAGSFLTEMGVNLTADVEGLRATKANYQSAEETVSQIFTRVTAGLGALGGLLGVPLGRMVNGQADTVASVRPTHTGNYINDPALRGWGTPGPAPSRDDAIRGVTTESGRQYRRDHIVGIDAAGVRLSVRREVAPIFTDLLTQLQSMEYAVNRNAADGGPNDWGYLHRNIGNSNQLSNHSWGLAIDINSDTNPQRRTLVTDMPAERVRELLRDRYGNLIRWGGDYTGNTQRDPMHFEWMGTPEQATQMTTHLNSLERQQNPVERQQNPVERQQVPLNRQRNPLDRQQAPLERQPNPVRRQR